MDTITIATKTGAQTVTARPCGPAGLCITGEKGAWNITHVPSGLAVCMPSLVNPNATLEDIKNAVFLAESAGLVLSEGIDWTADGDALPREACAAWVVSVLRSVRSASQNTP
jgi:hypothetical protein